MIIPIFWRERTKIKNLPELLDNYHKHGGAIVEYRRVFSILLYCRAFSVFEWVPPNSTRRAVGCKHALFCFLLGWWSVPGLLRTGSAIINNLMGGIDFTRILTTPPPLPGQPFDNTAMQELQLARKKQGYAFLIYLLVLLLIILVMVWPYIRKM